MKIVYGEQQWQVTLENSKVCEVGNLHGLKLEEGKEVPIEAVLTSHECSQEIETFLYESDNLYIEEHVKEMDGFLSVTRQYRNMGDQPLALKCVFEVKTAFKPTYYLIPGISYNGNKWGNGNEPKGLTRQGEPWVFRGDRTTLPACTFSENSDIAIGLMGKVVDGEEIDCASSILEEKGFFKHRVIWPENEGPDAYVYRDDYEKRQSKYYTLQKSESITCTALIYVNKVEEANTGWSQAYDRYMEAFQPEITYDHNAEETWDLGISFTHSLYNEENGQCFFERGLTPNKDKADLIYRPTDRVEMGWTGQHGVLCHALLKDYLRTGNELSRDRAVAVLDTWMSTAKSSSKLFYACYGESFDAKGAKKKADVCNIAWGAWQLLECYKVMKTMGQDKEEWKTMALDVCDFFLEKYHPEHFFGKSWEVATGDMVNGGGTIGIFMCIPLIEAYKLTNDKAYLDLAIKGFKDYATRDLDEMCCTAGALDTSCVDKETCWPFLKAGLDLYELTGEGYYLKEAEKAGYYLLSWMYHYNIPFNDGSDMESFNYKTLGGTSVSAQHHHLDPWGALIAMDWLRLGEIKSDDRWIARAKVTWANALQSISDGSLKVHGLTRPKGAQNEAFFHTDWFFSKDYEKKRYNDWLVAWPTAFRLCTLMYVENWQIFDNIISK